MDKKEFEKRLSKCSKESIAHCLYYNLIRHEHILAEIEIVEFDTKTKKLIYEMDRLNSLCRETKTDTPEGLEKYLEYSLKWKKTHDQMKKLQKWFETKEESEE